MNTSAFQCSLWQLLTKGKWEKEMNMFLHEVHHECQVRSRRKSCLDFQISPDSWLTLVLSDFLFHLMLFTLKWSLSKEQWKRRRKRIAIQIKYKALCFVWRTWILFPFNWWFNTKLQAFSFCSPGFPGFSSSCAWIFQGINWKEGGKKKKITELLQSLRVMSVRIEVEIQHETESETWNVFFSFQSLCLYFFSLPFKRIIIVSEGGFFSRTFPKGLCFACLWFYLLSLLFLYLEPWIKTIENRELLFPPLDRLDCHD